MRLTPAEARPASRRVSVGTLAVVELLSWGTLYYAYPVAAPRISDSTGWSHGLLAAVYSLSLVSAAVAGLVLGRLTDRAGDLRKVMPWCTAVGCGGLVLSTTGGLATFVVGWALVGVAQAGTLWGPAFIAITRWFEGTSGAWPMTVITAVGGSASLVFAPVVAQLTQGLGWRDTFVFLAIGYGAIAIPVQLLGLRATWHAPAEQEPQPRDRSVRSVVRHPRFLLLQLCMFLSGVALFSVTLNAVNLAVEKGADYTAAAFIFGLVGLGQVLGRLLFTSLKVSAHPWVQTRALMIAAALVLAAVAASPPVVLLALAAVLAGAVRGSHTLLMRNGVLDRWGTGDFGAVMSWFNLPVALGIALSPLIGAALASATGSFTSAALVAAAVALAGSAVARRT